MTIINVSFFIYVTFVCGKIIWYDIRQCLKAKTKNTGKAIDIQKKNVIKRLGYVRIFIGIHVFQTVS